jgi:hypothetical protein
MSSLSFLGNASSYLKIPNTNDFDFGTGDFTIEWYQYQTDSNPYPRVFQVGNYNDRSISIGVSIEGGVFYYWTNNAGYLIRTILTDYKNKWVHFAISRSSGVTQVFKNGVSIFSMEDANDFNGTNDLTIGNESTTPSTNAAFGGYLSYFTWVKGVALYTTNFTVSTTYPTLTNDYVLLLTASSFDGTLGTSVINSNVSTIQRVPSDSLSSNTTTSSNQTNIRDMKSLFTDN